MARRRMIDPNIWESEDYAQLGVLAKLVFIGMISNADDEGRGRASAVYLRSKVFPYDESIRSQDVSDALDEISSSLSVMFYRLNGNEYYAMRNWKKWQRVDKPQPSNIPPYDVSICEMMRNSRSVSEAEEGCNDANGDESESFPTDSGLAPEQFPPKRKEEKEKRKEEEYRAAGARVISFLNEKAGTDFRTDGKSSMRLIAARLSEGYTQEQMQQVIVRKCDEWNGTQMQNFLRPETLFGEKFEGYVNQKDGVSARGAPFASKRKRMEYEHDYDIALLERAMFGEEYHA